MRHLLISSVALLTFVLVAKADEKPKAEPAKAEAKTETKTETTETKTVEAKTETTEGGSVTCKSGNDVRTLTKTKPEGKACAVMYKKGDSESSVAEANSDGAYCDKVVEKIKGNLASAGYTCE